MSWEQTLDVLGGEVRFAPEEQEGMYTVEGLLRCSEPFVEGGHQFLAGFRKVNHPLSSALVDLPAPKRFQLLGFQVALRPALPPHGSQPDTFLDLSSRLLAPLRDKRETSFGYDFRAYLGAESWEEALNLRFNSTGHPRSAAEFAHLLEPYVIVAPYKIYEYPSSEEVIRAFETRWWSLHKG